MDKQLLTQNLKMLWATYHFAFRSKDPKVIADVIHVNSYKLHRWMKTDEWVECLNFWGQEPKIGDLNLAERLWTEMIEKNEDLFPINYPDVPESLSQSQHTLEVSTLIKSHLFCVDNLTENEIQDRLANENSDGMKPVCYEGQDLESAYHWWIFPNESEGVYSKCLARANVAGDLVIGGGEDTCFVIIRYGRLTITRQVSDDVVSVYDARLFVCL